MWLDMNLYKRTYVWGYDKNDISISWDLEQNIQASRIMFITEEVGDWRKANQIHKRFVTNIQDWNDNCAEYYVSRRKLDELLQLVEKVTKEPDLAEELLPCEAGFFFWSTAYDEWYFEELEHTKDILTEVLRRNDWEVYIYSSSW